MSDLMRNHLSNCEKFSLDAAQRLHILRYSGERDELIAEIMHSLLIIAEEARQGLKEAAAIRRAGGAA